MTKFKKVVAAALAGVLAVSFAACSKAGNDDPTSGNPSNNADAKAVKTGLGVVGQILSVEDTTLEINTVAAAVTVDENGKVVAIKIDEAQTKPDLAVENGTVADLRTKLEKQGDYGMKGVSPISKEWFEQVAAFEDWAVGKTADEIAAVAVGADGKTTDTDLASGCTITVTGFIEAATKAIKSAQDLGATSADTLNIALTTEKYYESNETNLQYDTDITAVTVDKDGKITSCLIDATQGKCAIADGKFTVEAGPIISKKELKDDYAMRETSAAIGIGKEWYEQAAAFEAWAVGKTAADLTASIAEDGKTSDAELKAGCTITVSSIAKNVAKAAGV